MHVLQPPPPNTTSFRILVGIYCHNIPTHTPQSGPKGLVHNLLMQFFTLGSSKIEVFETYFSDIVATQCDHTRYVKHILGRVYVFFTLFGIGCGGGGGVSQGIGTQPA